MAVSLSPARSSRPPASTLTKAILHQVPLRLGNMPMPVAAHDAGSARVAQAFWGNGGTCGPPAGVGRVACRHTG